MKTIEQAAAEFTAIGNYSSDRLLGDKQCFIAGAKFAQQWISVEKELPPESKTILVKFDYNDIDVAIWEHNRWRTNDREYNWSKRPTHWRAIELK
jgi:starvation-inducible outer membrane lipoprotein